MGHRRIQINCVRIDSIGFHCLAYTGLCVCVCSIAFVLTITCVPRSTIKRPSTLFPFLGRHRRERNNVEKDNRYAMQIDVSNLFRHMHGHGARVEAVAVTARSKNTMIRLPKEEYFRYVFACTIYRTLGRCIGNLVNW